MWVCQDKEQRERSYCTWASGSREKHVQKTSGEEKGMSKERKKEKTEKTFKAPERKQIALQTSKEIGEKMIWCRASI